MVKNHHWPTISLITPSYQQGQFLGQTINSVLAQNYPNLEYLVMDGGSTDNTVTVLRSYGDRVRWISARDGGQTCALNTGLQRTSGEIVGYLNSDDVLLPGALQRVATAFQSNPGRWWVSGDYEIITASNTSRDAMIVRYKRWQRQIMSRAAAIGWSILKINNPIIQPSTFWRRAAHAELGYLDESLRYCMDYDWWLRLWQQYGAPVFLPEQLSQFRIHEESKGGSQFGAQFAEEWRVAQRYHPSWVERLLHQSLSTATVAVYKKTR